MRRNNKSTQQGCGGSGRVRAPACPVTTLAAHGQTWTRAARVSLHTLGVRSATTRSAPDRPRNSFDKHHTSIRIIRTPHNRKTLQLVVYPLGLYYNTHRIHRPVSLRRLFRPSVRPSFPLPSTLLLLLCAPFHNAPPNTACLSIPPHHMNEHPPRTHLPH